MSTTFDRLTELASTPAAALDLLIETMRAEKNYHRMFDALMLKKKHEFGLPLLRPTSLNDVPADLRDEFERAYVAGARQAGQLLLDDGNIADAWLYFRTIQEKGPIAAVLDQTALPEDYEKAQQLINIALYEGANPVRGLQFLLKTNGTCNTITSLDQALPQMAPEDRRKAAALLVRHLYDELLQNVQADVQRRMPFAPPAATLHELILGRDWLFQDGNYHVDVSHLNSVTRFSRFLEAGSEELALSLQLAEYGSRLDQNLQYGGEVPFEEFYPAHTHYFEIMLGQNGEEAQGYFQQKLDNELDDGNRQMIAYVLVDLLVKSGRLDAAMPIAEKHLRFLEEQQFSFAELCLKSGRKAAWAEAAKEQGDLVGFTAALLS